MRQIAIVLDNVRSALNVGAIVRTCDGAGVDTLYICGITPTLTHPKVVKTALGAEKYVTTVYTPTTQKALDQLSSEGFELVAVEQTPQAVDFNQFAFPLKTALIFGHEITGVDPAVLSRAKHHVKVPMLGQKNSLNVATTVGIVTYYLALLGK